MVLYLNGEQKDVEDFAKVIINLLQDSQDYRLISVGKSEKTKESFKKIITLERR